MHLRAVEGSTTVAQLFMHMHYCRMVFVHECAPELGAVVPAGECLVAEMPGGGGYGRKT